MAGSLRYELEDRRVEAHAGQLIFLAQDRPHSLVQASADVALWVLELQLDQATEIRASGSRVLSKYESYLLNPSTAWREQFVSLLKKLWLRPSGQRLNVVEGRIFSALTMIHTSESARPLAVHPAVERARSICEQQASGDSDVQSLARAAGISASRLAHLFQRQLGISPLQYRNFAKLQNFIQICDLQAPSLLQTALQAGFGSYPQFHRIFHQVTGESPSAHLQWLLTTDAVEASKTLGQEDGKELA